MQVADQGAQHCVARVLAARQHAEAQPANVAVASARRLRRRQHSAVLAPQGVEEITGQILLEEHNEKENEKARAAFKAKNEETKVEIDYKTIDKFSWDDTGKFVKVYILSLEGVKDLPAEAIECDFSETGFEFKIRGLNGRNLRLAVPELHGKIDAEKSKLKLKSSSVTIQLVKADESKWGSLKKEGPEGPNSGVDMGGAPPGGMFGGQGDNPMGAKSEGGPGDEKMMKALMDMYETGDESMKKNITDGMMKAMAGQTPDAPK